MTTLVQQFATYCEQNSLPSDDVGSAAFYANWPRFTPGGISPRMSGTTSSTSCHRTFRRPSAPSRPTTGRLRLGSGRGRGEVTEQPECLRAGGHPELVTQSVDAAPVLAGYQLLFVLCGITPHQQPVHGLTARVPRERQLA